AGVPPISGLTKRATLVVAPTLAFPNGLRYCPAAHPAGTDRAKAELRLPGMPYCTNCGRGYTTADRYCERCGRLLATAAALMPPTEHGDYLASSIERALERTDERRRRRRNAVAGSNEGLD